MRRITPAGHDAIDAGLGLTARTWDRPALLARGQLTSEPRMPTAMLVPGGPPAPLPQGPALALPDAPFHDPLLRRPIDAATFLDRRLFNDALLVWHRGTVRHESYRNGMSAGDRHLAHSVTKTLTAMMIGIAIAQGRMHADAPIASYIPELATIPAWQGVTLQHVLDMTAGLLVDEHYDEPSSIYWVYAEAVGYYGAGNGQAAGALDFVLRHLHTRQAEPGTRFNYASCLTNLLPVALERVYGEPALSLYDRYLFQQIAAESDCLFNLDATGLPIVEGQASLTLRDLTRWALLWLHDGRNLAGTRVLPPGLVAATVAPDAQRQAVFARSDYATLFPGAFYRHKTWVLDAARGRYAMLGIHGQFAYFDAPNDLMITGFGSYPEQSSPLMKDCLMQLWQRVTDLAIHSGDH